MNASITLYRTDGTAVTLTDCIRFSHRRERYQPFDSLIADFLFNAANPQGFARAVFTLDGITLHDGSLREFSIRTEENQTAAHIVSRGFSEVLLQNQLVPGVHLNVTLASLMETYQLPHVTYESGISQLNYIYVKNNTPMWDAICAYNFKLNGGAPYVNACNALRVTPKSAAVPFVIAEEDVIATGCGGDTTTIVSRVDMADIDDTYGTFTRSNPDAAARGIVRVKQMLFDRQFLYEPDDALKFRIANSNRRLVSKTVQYRGYLGEDVEDTVAYDGFVNHRVSRIVITGDAHGVVTEDTFYFDSYCNVVPAAH